MNRLRGFFRDFFQLPAANNNQNNEEARDDLERRRLNFHQEFHQNQGEASNNNGENFSLIDTDEHASYLLVNRNGIPMVPVNDH